LFEEEIIFLSLLVSFDSKPGVEHSSGLEVEGEKKKRTVKEKKSLEIIT
jgi:hypothetical protein